VRYPRGFLSILSVCALGAVFSFASPSAASSLNLQFRPQPAVRVLDSRKSCVPFTSEGRTGCLVALPISESVKAVAVQLTVVSGGESGFAVVQGVGLPFTGTSNANFDIGNTASNLAIVPLSDNRLFVGASVATSALIVDLQGVFVPASGANEGNVVPVAPSRLLDTRPGVKLAAGGLVEVPVTVPAGASGVLFSLTAVDATPNGFFTAWIDGERPNTSVLNIDRSGQTKTSGLTILSLPASVTSSDSSSTSQTITLKIWSQSGAHLLVDLFAFFGRSASPSVGNLLPSLPERVYDSRSTGMKRLPNRTWVSGAASSQPSGSQILNVTATGILSDGYVSVWSRDRLTPPTSNLNVSTAQSATSAAAFVPAGSGVAVFHQSAASIVVDTLATFSDASESCSQSDWAFDCARYPAVNDDIVPADSPVVLSMPSAGFERKTRFVSDVELFDGTAQRVIDSGSVVSWNNGPSETVFFAHRTSHGGSLRRLSDLAVGDQIFVSSAADAPEKWAIPYTVDSVRVVRASEIDSIVLNEQRGEGVVLFACACSDGSAGCVSHRLLVHASPSSLVRLS
jgi:hypothetical protein